jgi:beta-lactamase regulating signal transducer with metallopeptidase domain
MTQRPSPSRAVVNQLLENLNDSAAAWAATMFAVLWQSTVLAAVVAAACWALWRQSPRVRYWLWLLLAAKLLALPLWTFGITWPRHFTPESLSTASTEMAPPVDSRALASPTTSPINVAPAPTKAVSAPLPPRPTATWQAWLLILWLAVVIAEIARTAWQFRRLRMLLAAAQPAPPEVVALVAECARMLDLKVEPAVRQIDCDGSPLVCGPVRPVLVIPAATLAAFEAPALQQIVLHELAHVRRRDLWTIWIIHAMRTIYWFHPVAHWIAYRAGLDRELACDELAMVHSGATAGVYARTLIRAVARSAQPLVMTAAAAARLDGGDVSPATSSSHPEKS